MHARGHRRSHCVLLQSFPSLAFIQVFHLQGSFHASTCYMIIAKQSWTALGSNLQLLGFIRAVSSRDSILLWMGSAPRFSYFCVGSIPGIGKRVRALFIRLFPYSTCCTLHTSCWRLTCILQSVSMIYSFSNLLSVRPVPMFTFRDMTQQLQRHACVPKLSQWALWRSMISRADFRLCSIPQWPRIPGLHVSEVVKAKCEDLGDPIAALLDTRIRCVEFCGPPDARQTIVDAPRAHAVVLPGSFNPLHEGHMCVSHNNDA